MRNIKFDAIDSTLDLITDNENGLHCSRDGTTFCCSVDANGELTGSASCIYRKRP